METSFHVPMWLLHNVGGFVGFGIFSLLLVKYRRVSNVRRIAKCSAKEKEKRQQEEKKRQQKLQEKKQKRLENESVEAKLRRVLPEVWRRLYDVLHNEKKATKSFVILALKTFRRDVLDPLCDESGVHPSAGIPRLSPSGLEAILDVSYYNLGGNGNCHKEVLEMFEQFVSFPEAEADFSRFKSLSDALKKNL